MLGALSDEPTERREELTEWSDFGEGRRRRAARRSYEAVAARAGLELVHDGPDLIRLSNGNGSFTLIEGPPTENADVTFL